MPFKRTYNVTMTTGFVALPAEFARIASLAAGTTNAGTITYRKVGTTTVINELNSGDSVDLHASRSLGAFEAKSTNAGDVLILTLRR